MLQSVFELPVKEELRHTFSVISYFRRSVTYKFILRESRERYSYGAGARKTENYIPTLLINIDVVR